MAKKKTFKERRESGEKYLRVYEPFTSDVLKNRKIVIDTLLECIREDDIDTFREVLVAHLMTVNKMSIVKKAGIGRRTLYDLLDFNKKFNPELSTVTALIRAIAA